MTQSKPTQNQRILEYITDFGAITQLDALRDLGVMRLASRVSDLKRQGYPIQSKVVGVKIATVRPVISSSTVSLSKE